MNIWAKMMTALRGGVSEAGEAVIDGQALRILDQEVRDASQANKDSKDSLTEIMARQKVAEQKCIGLKKQIEDHEGYAIKALDKGDDKLAYEVAEKIADLESQFVQESEAEVGFASSAGKIRTAIKQTERNLKRLKQQVDTVKATENVQRAQSAVAERHSGSHSKMRTAMDSLERIKEKQNLKSAQMSAASELAEETSDASLQTKLEEAGIASSANSAESILERLKKKNSK
jgi:phage shock protein A